MTEIPISKIEIKKIILALISLALAFLLVLISIFSITNTKAAETTEYVIEEVGDEMEATDEGMLAGQPDEATVAAGIEKQPEQEYRLPYPGILPDHPLYWLKMVRDRMWLWFTRDPGQKIDRLVLYADKRLGAGKALIEGNKENLGMTTITKAEKYLQLASEELRQADDWERVQAMSQKINASAKKHQAVLVELKNELPKELIKPWEIAFELTEKILTDHR